MKSKPGGPTGVLGKELDYEEIYINGMCASIVYGNFNTNTGDGSESKASG